MSKELTIFEEYDILVKALKEIAVLAYEHAVDDLICQIAKDALVQTNN